MPATSLPEAPERPPQPLPSLDSQPFWDRLARGELAIQRCLDCRAWQFPFIARCRRCAGVLAVEAISGRGTVYSYIVEHRRVAPGFDHLLPYVIALVTPDEAPDVRIPSRLPDVPPDAVWIGMPVQAQILPLAGGAYAAPVFHPI